ncbi:ferrodoxin [Candidatus Photodesmus blepharus]|uniref:Ferrodoxin n=1 Tax=Candidatus Photodesmus blepharonis TaxID=1179155 RepID=A0A084CNU2_9GAMM|nr:YfhL family 4Fe-4S dicluster ferredoxin [Candidatus Photodesmus blepharus]KEY91471.1 ferrodoxin [Candidatus Photodesmus blepharus]
MALLITKKCINCDMCRQECPNGAISMTNTTFQIAPELCTECKGSYDKPTCKLVCPINKCIILDPKKIETEEELLEKFVIIRGLV